MYRVRSLLKDAKETLTDMAIWMEIAKIEIIAGFAAITFLIGYHFQEISIAIAAGWINGLLSVATVRWVDRVVERMII